MNFSSDLISSWIFAFTKHIPPLVLELWENVVWLSVHSHVPTAAKKQKQGQTH